jgi:hypothetical protein
MIVVEKSAGAYTLGDAQFELAFRHVGDRWQHCVSVANRGEWFPLLTSVEGTPADAGPPSPPWQDLRFEQLADNVFEFQLMGQSRKGVYSAAVRLDGDAGTIDFDLCSRGRSQESPLCTASSYILPGDNLLPHIQQFSSGLVLVPLGGLAIDLSPVPISDSPVCECRLTTVQYVRQINVGCFDVTGPGLPGKGFSVRWRFRMSLILADGLP